MLNPTILLGLTAFYLLSIGGAYFKGSQHAQDKARAEYSTQLEASIKEANENAVIDAQAAAEVAAKEAAARTRTAMLRTQANDATRSKPMPVTCNLDTERVRVLSVAIQEANGDSADATKRVRDATIKVNAAIGK